MLTNTQLIKQKTAELAEKLGKTALAKAVLQNEISAQTVLKNLTGFVDSEQLEKATQLAIKYNA
jgi:hypothetical protein